jgi:hypothetical protein
LKGQARELVKTLSTTLTAADGAIQPTSQHITAQSL